LVVVAILACVAVSGIQASPALNNKVNEKKPLVQGGEDPDPEIRERRNFVQRMMQDAWDDYVRHAWGNNELKPISQTGQTGGIFGTARIGATIVDSLDTLYIMGMMDEYEHAKDFVVTNLTFSNVDASISIFETNIRFVGGFLAAYALTQDDIYRQRATEIATLLLPAFDTPTGIPYSYFNIKTLEPNPSSNAVLAEFGTLHLEFTYLSEITGNPIFKEKVDHIRQYMKNIVKPNGLYPNFINIMTGQWSSSHISIGALGDSYYEYLIKAYIQLGDEEAGDLYDEAMDAFVANNLVKTSVQNRLLYIAESNNDQAQNVVGHLACFAGGMFAIGAHTRPNNTNAARDAEIGRNFTNTCHESYIRTNSHIGPEVFRFNDNLEAEAEFDSDKGYILRPEVLESYFILYRITGDRKYRDWAWDAAQAIESLCKAGPGRGYSGLRNVYAINPVQDDVQQTFFLAETLKYLYLIFSTDDLIDLNQWVFNTECHPLPVKGTNPLY